MKDVSLDIEACGEVVLSIGAVEFDRETGELGREFYAVPAIASQLEAGLKMDAGAFLWWLKQGDPARQAITDAKDGEPVLVVLSRLRDWMRQLPGDSWLWAYPTSFDLPVLERLYRAFHIKVPWQWTRTMDGRTLWKLACAIDPEAEKIEKDAEGKGIPHHALEDAKEQAAWYVRYLRIVMPARVVYGDPPGTIGYARMWINRRTEP